MSIVADSYRFVVGVDTHARIHQFAIIDTSTGGVMGDHEFATSPAGLERAAEWIGRHTDGDLDGVLISAEGTGSFGAVLARLLLARGYRVTDAPTPKRDRGADKNDRIDAIKAARNVLAVDVDHLVDVKAGETTDMLGVLLAARDRITTESTRTFNALVALLRTHDLGFDARRKPSIGQIRQIARWRPVMPASTTAEVAKAETVTLAKRFLQLHRDAKTNSTQVKRIVTEHMPVLLEQPGIGPINAAVLLAAWSHPGRIRDEAAFARLAGVSPIQVASGNRSEHRLNRGGDRQLNRALHSIVLTRMRFDPDTRAYVQRRQSEQLSNRRIRRVLKRYVARQAYRLISAQQAPTSKRGALQSA